MLEGLNSGGHFPFGVDDEIRPRGRELYSTAYNNSFCVPDVHVVCCSRTIVLLCAGHNSVIRRPKHFFVFTRTTKLLLAYDKR